VGERPTLLCVLRWGGIPGREPVEAEPFSRALSSSAAPLYAVYYVSRRECDMNDDTLTVALDAVHDEALKLLKHELSTEVRQRVELILSIARHRHDVRTAGERESA
jgi:hypothetical protein